MNRTAADNFWDFSLAIYRLPGVADRLIALQDDYDADVNLVLFCCWCGHEGRLPLEATSSNGPTGISENGGGRSSKFYVVCGAR